MGLYEVVLAPAVFVNDDGTVTVYRESGALIECSAEYADQVGGALRELGVEPVEETPVDPPATGQPATFIEEPAPPVEPAGDEPVSPDPAPADEAPKPRSRKPKDAEPDGQS